MTPDTPSLPAHITCDDGIYAILRDGQWRRFYLNYEAPEDLIAIANHMRATAAAKGTDQ